MTDDVVFDLAEGATKSGTTSRFKQFPNHVLKKDSRFCGTGDVFFDLAEGATTLCTTSLFKQFSNHVFKRSLAVVGRAMWFLI